MDVTANKDISDNTSIFNLNPKDISDTKNLKQLVLNRKKIGKITAITQNNQTSPVFNSTKSISKQLRRQIDLLNNSKNFINGPD